MFSSQPLRLDEIRVVIIGAGLAGLSAAISLQQAGISDIKIYERDSSYMQRRQGYGMTLTKKKGGALERLGILDECLRLSCKSKCHWFFTSQGFIKGYYGRAFLNQDATEADDRKEGEEERYRGNLRIPRQRLRKMLLNKIDKSCIHWGVSLLDYTETDGGISVLLNGHMGAVDCDVLIGADGLNSKVRLLRELKTYNNVVKHPLTYLGVSCIIGISRARHPLIEEQGFYICEDGIRLFTMPFQQSHCGPGVHDEDQGGAAADERETAWTGFGDYVESFGSKVHGTGSQAYDFEAMVEAAMRAESQHGIVDVHATPGDSSFAVPGQQEKECERASQVDTLHMWQLSFADIGEEEARERLLVRGNGEALLALAIEKTSGWMCPVGDLITATRAEDVWASPLYDREPLTADKDVGGRSSGRVLVIGDACHPMSMFKGQGANQALEDGPLLSWWLRGGPAACKAERKKKSEEVPTVTPKTLTSRLKCFEREMVNRSAKMQAASRAAAKLLHGLPLVQESDRLPSSDAEAALVFGFQGLVDEYKLKASAASTQAGTLQPPQHGHTSVRQATGGEALALALEVEQKLRRSGIGAWDGSELEEKVKTCLQTL